MSSEENDKIAKGPPGQGTPIRDEIAVMLRRIMDRVLPNPEGDQCAPKLVRYGVTFLGTTFWVFVVLLWFMQMIGNQPATTGPTSSGPFEPAQLLGTANLVGFLIDSPYAAIVLCLIICLMFTCLIATTFRHGRPLTFFFCGLIYPSLAVSIVKYAFLS